MGVPHSRSIACAFVSCCAGMGVVTKVGSGVTSFQEGQRVTALGWMGHEGSGSWQQYINVPAERVVALPDGITDEAGAQSYVSVQYAAPVLLLDLVCMPGWL